MKKTFLLIVVPALLVAMGFAQTPAPSTNADQTNINGCLGGSDGNYTVVEDNTGHIFKISTSSVDLKPHLNHDVTLIGQKASAVSSGPADNNFAVTELNMISEHCAAAAAATVSAPSEITATPAASDTAPAATVSPVPETAVTPAAPATPPAGTAVTPAADATPPPAEAAITPAPVPAAPATVSTPSEPASKPVARHRSQSAAPAAASARPAAAGASPSEPASKTPSAGTPPSDTSPVTASSSAEPASAPVAVATTPTATSRSWSLWLLVAFGVLILVLGTMFPFFSRWRKQKSLERTDTPNLSLIREASPGQSKSDRGKSDQGKIDPPVTRKAA